MHKHVHMMALCMCIAETGFSQEFGSTNIDLQVSGGNAAAQSFYFPGGEMEFIEMAAFTRYQSTAHPAEFRIVTGDTPFGVPVFAQATEVTALERFYPVDSFIDSSIFAYEMKWADIQLQIDTGALDLEDMLTGYDVNMVLPAGYYTAVLSLDTNVSNNGYRWMTSFSNCIQDFGWCPNYQLNPYLEGSLYWGADLTNAYTDENGVGLSDMAFRVKWSETSTTVTESDPARARNIAIGVYDLQGRLVATDIDYLRERSGLYVVDYGGIRKTVMAPFVGVR